MGLQFIDPKGGKKFLTGTKKKGSFHFIGELDHVKPVLLLAEGYATAASIHMALKYPVLVCFDAGNLQPVAEAWKKRLPHVDIIICGDNDAKTKGNPGLTKAKAAAKAVNGRFVIPFAVEVNHAK
jgi:putative DNA primase/helicase